MAFTNVWDDTFPADTQLANQLGLDLRNFRLDTQQRMAAISGLDASKPAFGADAQPANWNGILFFAIDTGKIYQFNNPSWTDVTASFKGGVTKYNTATPVTKTNVAGDLQSVVIPGGSLSVGQEIHINAEITAAVTAGGAIGLALTFAGIQVQWVANIGFNDLVNFHARGIVKDSSHEPLMCTIATSSGNKVQTNMIFGATAISGPITVKTNVTASGATFNATGNLLMVDVF